MHNCITITNKTSIAYENEKKRQQVGVKLNTIEYCLSMSSFPYLPLKAIMAPSIYSKEAQMSIPATFSPVSAVKAEMLIKECFWSTVGNADFVVVINRAKLRLRRVLQWDIWRHREWRCTETANTNKQTNIHSTVQTDLDRPWKQDVSEWYVCLYSPNLIQL